MASEDSPFNGIVGSGPKRRKIKAFDVAINSPFEFNKSITPHGGTKASIFVSDTKKGFALVEIFQDLNNDDVIKKKERIYKGQCLEPDSGDELINFFGDIKLTKTMHKCTWLTQKNPEKVAACTMELIPTVYSLTLKDESDKIYEFDPLGPFKSLSRSMPAVLDDAF